MSRPGMPSASARRTLTCRPSSSLKNDTAYARKPGRTSSSSQMLAQWGESSTPMSNDSLWSGEVLRILSSSVGSNTLCRQEPRARGSAGPPRSKEARGRQAHAQLRNLLDADARVAAVLVALWRVFGCRRARGSRSASAAEKSTGAGRRLDAPFILSSKGSEKKRLLWLNISSMRSSATPCPTR